MVDQAQLDALKTGATAWNRWRLEHPDVTPSLIDVSLRRAQLSGADLHEADLTGADLIGADLTGAILTDAYVQMADLRQANLTGARMSGIDLGGSNLSHAILANANMPGAFLAGGDLFHADLTNANLSDADLSYVQMAEARINQAVLTGARVYATSAWALRGRPKDQSRLNIMPFGAPPVTVDDLEMAQFVYLVSNNANLERVFNTLTSKAVLILGRFTDGRNEILSAIHSWLRGHGYVPIVFNFDRPEALTMTETVKALGGISRFVIADIGMPRSVQQELQATVSTWDLPVVPIIQCGEEPWSMFRDIESRNWVLRCTSYKDVTDLVDSLGRLVEKVEDQHRLMVVEKSRPSLPPIPIDQV